MSIQHARRKCTFLTHKQNTSIVATWGYTSIKNLNDLDLKCDSNKLGNSAHLDAARVLFQFDSSFILNQTFDLNVFARFDSQVFFTFLGLRKIDLETRGPIFEFDSLSRRTATSQFSFDDLSLAFYYKGDLIDENLCDLNILGSVDVRLFSNIKSMGIMANSDLMTMCPIVFRNARVGFLYIENLETDLIQKKSFKFFTLKNRENFTLNSTVDQMTFGTSIQL